VKRPQNSMARFESWWQIAAALVVAAVLGLIVAAGLSSEARRKYGVTIGEEIEIEEDLREENVELEEEVKIEPVKEEQGKQFGHFLK